MKNDGELLRTWKRNDYKLKLFYYGTEILGYEFFHKGKLIFEGRDFRPSRMYCIDSLESVYALLSFLSLKPGDIEGDYFKNYTREQLAFVIEHGEELGHMVIVAEEKIYKK